jgi:hypothetical protein
MCGEGFIKMPVRAKRIRVPLLPVPVSQTFFLLKRIDERCRSFADLTVAN